MAAAIAADVENLRQQLEDLQSSLSRNLTKDVSLVAGLKEWSGDSKGKSVREFFAQIETFAKVSHWTDLDIALIAKAKLQGLALQFLNGRKELLKDTCPYAVIKRALIERFTEKMPDQYHYSQLQDAVQGRGETAEEFDDRCRKLCQKTKRRVDNAVAQVVLNEEAERRLVAAYINGLRGVVGQQVKFRMAEKMEEAVRLAITIENAEQQWPSDRRVFAIARADVECYSCHRKGHISRNYKARSYARPRGGSNSKFFSRNGWTTERGRGRNPMVSRGWARPTPPVSSESRGMRDRQQHRGSGNPNAEGPVSSPRYRPDRQGVLPGGIDSFNTYCLLRHRVTADDSSRR
jgi:hypothetical protein